MPDMQHETPTRRPYQSDTWQRTRVAECGTFHDLDGRPLYARRFETVQKFHPPGLAPAQDPSGAFHITVDGVPAYAHRYRQTWGYYGGLAAVEDDKGWLHVQGDGSPRYGHRFGWCGNFQETRCAVRSLDGAYFHIDEHGCRAYPESYGYVGDFRDGAAVVRSSASGLCTHIDRAGALLHGGHFIGLDVFHKGSARARDELGWFHVNRCGEALYPERFASVEPFYNGQARCETFDGAWVIVAPDGTTVHAVVTAARSAQN